MSEPRVCLLGGSHLACLMQAMKATPPDERPDWTFFAAPGGRTMNQLELRDGELIARRDELRQWLERSSGGRSSVTLADFDVFVLFGMALGVRYAFDVALEGFAIPEMSTFGREGYAPISRAFLKAGLCHWLGQSSTSALLGKLRAAAAQPVLVVPEPQPTGVPAPRKSQARFAAPTGADLRVLGELRMEALRDYASEQRVPLIVQPPETLTPFLMTREAYGREAPRLEGEEEGTYGAADRAHMNAEFGALRIAQLRSVIASL